MNLGTMEGGQWHQSQPDDSMARNVIAKLIWNVAFRQPQIHTSDHCAVVVLLLRGRHGWMKQQHWRSQTFPLQLPPVEEQDEQTYLFGGLQKTCKEAAPVRRKCSDWISEESWQLIAHQVMLCCTSHLYQMGGAAYTAKLVHLFARIGLTRGCKPGA